MSSKNRKVYQRDGAFELCTVIYAPVYRTNVVRLWKSRIKIDTETVMCLYHDLEWTNG